MTDANLLMGRLRPDRFLGGEFTLDLERARRITSEWLKKQGSRLSLEQFSAGVVRVVNANMERALRVVSIERGYDPREFALVAFGGAGGLHACELAEALAIPTVMIPARPGALSAFGILVSDVVKDYLADAAVAVCRSPSARMRNCRANFASWKQAAQKEFRAERWRGALHYRKQSRPALSRTRLRTEYAGRGRTSVARFHAEHQRRYGYHHAGREIELVTLRLRVRMKAPKLNVGPTTQKIEGNHRDVSPAAESAAVIFQSEALATPVYERSELRPGQFLKGPAVITEYSATTVIPPGKRFWLDRMENLLIATGPRKAQTRRAAASRQQ